MAATRRCPNGHEWATTAVAGSCPICGAPVGTSGAATVAEPAAEHPRDTRTGGWDHTIPLPGVSAVPVPGYELLGELGRGGMGVVFRARQVKLNRVVALKMVLSGELASALELARFKAEAEAAAQLQHPNIVQLYEFGEVRSGDGALLPYFALEYINGGSLADRLDGTPRPARWAAQLIESVARAMYYAHSQGVIHRDLKPANVLLVQPQQPDAGPGSDAFPPTIDVAALTPKVTDFGLAKRMDGSTGQTQSGAILGTPQYMAPEQAAGKSKRVGLATDIYSLGAILYELVTGRPPFQGETPLETILQVTRDDPVPPRLLNPGVPRDLETITLKCLQKDPARRYDSAQSLADDLARFLDDQPITARPAGAVERGRAWMRRHPTATALMTVTAVAAATLLAVGYRSHVKLRAEMARTANERDRAHRRQVDLTIANGAHRADDGDVPLALPWYAEALSLDQTDADRSAVHRMRLAAALAACPPLIAAWGHGSPVTDAAFRPDGGAVVTADAAGVVRVWNPHRPEAPPRTFRFGAAVTQVAYRSDGTRLLAVSGADVHVWNPAAGLSGGTVLSHPKAVSRAVWSGDGSEIVTGCGDGNARVWNANTGRPTGIEVAPCRRRHGRGYEPNRRARDIRRSKRHGRGLGPGHRPTDDASDQRGRGGQSASARAGRPTVADGRRPRGAIVDRCHGKTVFPIAQPPARPDRRRPERRRQPGRHGQSRRHRRRLGCDQERVDGRRAQAPQRRLCDFVQRERKMGRDGQRRQRRPRLGYPVRQPADAPAAARRYGQPGGVQPGRKVAVDRFRGRIGQALVFARGNRGVALDHPRTGRPHLGRQPRRVNPDRRRRMDGQSR